MVNADLVKSLYLSVSRYEEQEKRDRYAGELAETASALKAGGSVVFVPDELERLSKQLEMVRGVTARMVWGTLGRFFLPGALFVVGLLALAWIVRAAK